LASFSRICCYARKKSLNSLEFIQKFFGCGKIFINRRRDNHREDIYRYCVRSIKDIDEKIIPFFSENSLRTEKKKDFELFVKIIKLMLKQEHYNLKGLKKVANLIQRMNRKKPSKFLESSETTR